MTSIFSFVERYKMVLAYEKHDTVTRYDLPNTCPSDYYINDTGKLHFPMVFNEHMYYTCIKTNRYADHVRPMYHNARYVKLSDIKGRYLYPIFIFNVSYFIENEKFGLKYVDDRVIEDANNGLCKIVFIQPVEGTSGAKGFPEENDFLIIEKWCNERNLKTSSVHYICGNLISDIRAKEQGCTFNVHPITIQEIWNNIINFSQDTVEFNPQDTNYLYLNYNRQPRIHRVIMLSKLIKHDLFNLGKNSFNTMGRTFDDLKYDLELFEEGLSIQGAQLFDMAPIFVDRDNSEITSSVGDVDNYKNSFISLITETLINEGTLFCSEKTWRAIIVGHPFILLTTKGVLKYLKSLGFQTFSKWIDESYDDTDDLKIKINIITSELEKFSKKSLDELKNIRQEMLPVLIHNKEHMIKLCKNKYSFKGKSNYHEAPVEKLLFTIWDSL